MVEIRISVIGDKVKVEQTEPREDTNELYRVLNIISGFVVEKELPFSFSIEEVNNIIYKVNGQRIGGYDYKYTILEPLLYLVKSDSDREKFYLVSFAPLLNRYVCSCPDSHFRLRECKHIARIPNRF